MITNIVIAYRAVLTRSAAKLLPERNSPEKGIFNSLFIASGTYSLEDYSFVSNI